MAEYDIMAQPIDNENPCAADYDPKWKMLSTERRTTMAPQLAKQSEERFKEDADKLNAPAPGQYDPNVKATERRTTAAPRLSKMQEDRFDIPADKLNAPAPGQYDPNIRATERRMTAGPQLEKMTVDRF